MNKLSTRQVGILLFINAISLKLVSFPAIFASYAGSDGYLGMLIVLLVDLFCIAIVIFVAKRNPNKTYEDIIKDTFGEVVLKFVNFGLFLYLFIKAVLLINEHHNYLLEVLFTYLPWQLFIIPMLILMMFIMSRSIRAVGRSAEIFFVVIVIGVIFTILIPIEYFDISSLFPVFENGFSPIIVSSFNSSFTGGDFIVLYMLLGRFKLEKNSYKKIFSFAVFASIIIFAFYMIFFGVFGSITPNQSLAISDLPLFSSFPKYTGRLDWITINLWMFTLAFQTGVCLSLCLQAFKKTFNFENKHTGIVVITGSVYVGTYLIFINLVDLLEFVTTSGFNTAIISFEITVLILLFFSVFKNRRVRHEKLEKNMAK